MSKIDIYQEITDKIVAALENGVLPWRRSWNSEIALPRRVNGDAYRGVNVILLWMAEMVNDYQHHVFMTFNQAKSLTARVIKGEKGHPIIKFGTFSVENEDTGEDEEKIYLKRYTVFNVDQIDGLPERPEKEKTVKQTDKFLELDKLIKNTGVDIHTGSFKACYHPDLDRIAMPAKETFNRDVDYYTTFFHELGHWTGHKSRLNRTFGKKKTSPQYAFEELIAELTSCFVCANYGVPLDIDNSASYLDSWLSWLMRDKRYFFRACSQAQKAADFILAFSK